MYKRQLKLKAAPICWHQFTRHKDAIFRSLGKEIRIGLMYSVTDLNCEIRTTGRILVDNEDRSNPYTHVAGSGNPTVTVKVGTRT